MKMKLKNKIVLSLFAIIFLLFSFLPVFRFNSNSIQTSNLDNINSSQTISKTYNIVDSQLGTKIYSLSNNQFYMSMDQNFLAPSLWSVTNSIGYKDDVTKYEWNINQVSPLYDVDPIYTKISIDDQKNAISILFSTTKNNINNQYMFLLTIVDKDGDSTKILDSVPIEINVVSRFKMWSNITNNIDNFYVPLLRKGSADSNIDFYFDNKKLNCSNVSNHAIYLKDSSDNISYSFSSDYSKIKWKFSADYKEIKNGDNILFAFLFTYEFEKVLYHLSIFINCIFYNYFEIEGKQNSLLVSAFYTFDYTAYINTFKFKSYSIDINPSNIEWKLVTSNSSRVKFSITSNGDLYVNFLQNDIGFAKGFDVYINAIYHYNPIESVLITFTTHVKIISSYFFVIPIVLIILVVILLVVAKICKSFIIKKEKEAERRKKYELL